MPTDMSKPDRTPEHSDGRPATRYGLPHRQPRQSQDADQGQSQVQGRWQLRQSQIRQGNAPESSQGQSQRADGRSQSQSQSTDSPGRGVSFAKILPAKGVSFAKDLPVTAETVATGICVDLAVNPPGIAAEERARRMRSTAPMKSRAERLLMVRNAEAGLRATAVAERKVANDLDHLGPEWKILHSVPIGPDRPEVSHLLIGPQGVFTLASRTFRTTRTKSFEKVEAQVHGDAIRIHGETMPWVAEARAQAWRTARALSAAADMPVYVRSGVIVLGVDDVRVYGKPPERVEVLHRRLLMKWLQRFPVEARAATVNHVYAAARRSDTWVDLASSRISLDKPR